MPTVEREGCRKEPRNVSHQTQKNYWTGAAVAGGVLAILFGILAATSSGGNQGAYIAACVVFALIGVASVVILLVRR